jgi:FkbM family methyltransferase
VNGLLSRTLQGFLRSGGFDLKRRHHYRHPAMLVATKSKKLGVDTILDVGANEGQFAQDLRDASWLGRVVSFEPQSVAHENLCRAAEGRWEVGPRCAIGRADGETTINLSAHSVSSSLLPVLSRSTQVAPATAYTGTETVSVRSLDSLLEDGWGRLALKVDTQGFEAEVLAGAQNTLQRIQVACLEVSLTALYERAPVGSTLFKLMENVGFRCISIIEGFSDPRENEMLSVDAIFVRL